jgi:hypothetical protein
VKGGERGMGILKRLFLRISNEINYRMGKDLPLRKLLEAGWTDDRCLFCLHSIPEDEFKALIFRAKFRDGDHDIEEIQMICPECGNSLALKDRENLIRIYKAGLRREFPVVSNRGKFEADCVDRMNNILDNVE